MKLKKGSLYLVHYIDPQSSILSLEQLFLKYYGVHEGKKHDIDQWNEILTSKNRK